MSDPRFVAPHFAPERFREGRSRPSCLATRRIGTVNGSAFAASRVAIDGGPETVNAHAVAACDRIGHHVIEHRAVLDAVHGSARRAAHARGPRVAFGP